MAQPYEELERRWALFNDLDPDGMIVCSSGTAALHLALEVLGLPIGSKVIVPDYTMIACPRAATLAGLTPVFVDCRDDLLTDPDILSKESGELGMTTSAIMPVHVYGRRINMDYLIWTLGRYMTRWLPIVEDLAEAHGVKPHAKTDAACWSFYRNKIVAGEEGGAVYFRDRINAEVARELRSLGFTRDHDFQHRPRGHNYRLANCLAEKVLQGLDRYKWNRIVRENSILSYELVCPNEWRMPGRDVPWVYDVRIPGLTRDKQKEIVKTLNELKVEARMGFYPCSMQSEYSQGYDRFHREAPMRSHAATGEVFYLPLLPEVSGRDAKKIFDMIAEVLKEGKPSPTGIRR